MWVEAIRYESDLFAEEADHLIDEQRGNLMRHMYGRVGGLILALVVMTALAPAQSKAGGLFGRDTKVTTVQTPGSYVLVPSATQPINYVPAAMHPMVPAAHQIVPAAAQVQAAAVPATYTATSYALEPVALAQAQSISLAERFQTLRARLGQDISKLGGLITFLRQAKSNGTLHKGALLKLGIEFIAKVALGGIVPTDVIVDVTDLIDEFIFGQPAVTAGTKTGSGSQSAATAGGSSNVNGSFQGKVGSQDVNGQINGTLNVSPASSANTTTTDTPPASAASLSPSSNNQPTTGATNSGPISEISDSILGLQSQVQSLNRRVDRLSTTKP